MKMKFIWLIDEDDEKMINRIRDRLANKQKSSFIYSDQWNNHFYFSSTFEMKSRL